MSTSQRESLRETTGAPCPHCGAPMKGWAEGGWCDRCGAAFGENAGEAWPATIRVVAAGQSIANCSCNVEGPYGRIPFCPAHPREAPTESADGTDGARRAREES